MMNLLRMGIPPDIFYIYMILDPDARKIFNVAYALTFSPGKRKRGLDFFQNIKYLKPKGENLWQQN